MREPEQLHGVRIVAKPAAIDVATAAATRQGAIVIRIAPDDAFMIGVTDMQGSGVQRDAVQRDAVQLDAVQLDDPHAIVEPESAFVGWWLTADEVLARVARHVEWQLPSLRAGHTQLAQGLVAGIPMKLWFSDPADASADGPRVLVMVSRGLAHEAQDRLFRTSSMGSTS